MTHVVVIGAGFAGLQVAKGLANEPVEVTVVDRHNFHTFLPLLYQVATAGLNPADIAHPVRGIFHDAANVDFRVGTVVGVDWERKEVLLDEQAPLGFDELVVAAGSSANFFGTPGAAEHAYPLYALPDAVELRNHLLEQFEAADQRGRVEEGALRFVIVGAGPTGVETAGAIVELIDMVLRDDFRTLDVGHAEVVLVEMADTVLTAFEDPAQRHAIDALEARGVLLRLGTSVAEITAEGVRFESGEFLSTRNLIWAAGVKANTLVDALDVPVGRGGRIEVDQHLRIRDRDHAWAVGDVAHIVPASGDLAGEPLPQLAPAAIQTGEHAAQNLLRACRGESLVPFRYRDKGIMATVGRRSAVAQLRSGRVLTGTMAWLAWLALHLYFLIGFRNRVSVLVNWAWNYVTWDRGPRLILRPPPSRTP